MRKRAQRRFKPTPSTTEVSTKKFQPTVEKKPLKITKNSWIAIALIVVFFLVLFFNTYFNFTSDIAYNAEGEGLAKYYLSGPDPYYNMRLVEGTYETGQYPYYSEEDPLLNYPKGALGARAPLLNMMALGFSRLLTPFMDEVDAIGRSMQFVPALFGALLIFPVYFIGKTLFNKKAGLIAAFLLAIIPIHIGSGHGSAYSLFDHDSFNLLLFFTTFLFLILSLREKNYVKSLLLAILGGVSLAGLTMVWVDAQFLYVVIAIYAIVQILIDIFYSRYEPRVFTTTTLMLFSGYLISLPVIISRPGGFNFDITLLLSIVVLVFGGFYYLLSKKKIPWLLSLPSILVAGGIGLIFIYFIRELATTFSFLGPIRKLSNVIFGTGIYGNKVSMTIAEANTYQISNTVMSFGPALYWIGWAGLILTFYLYYKQKLRRDFLFVIVIFIINLWLAGTAGRFLNDTVPWIAILAGWVIIVVINRIDYKQMLRNIKSAGGGLHGLRRGIKVMHIVGALFIAFIVILPNAFIAFDAALPNKPVQDEEDNWVPLKEIYFGSGHSGAYGLSIVKEKYWANAFNWLSKQDTHIERDVNRPAFISWWDYGFYEAALGEHPTVADNFQDGIPPAANFHTSTSEQEAVTIWIVRLLEGNLARNGKISDDVKDILNKYFEENVTNDISSWVALPTLCPSYDEPIGAEYDKNLSEDYRIGQQYDYNALYQDVANIIVNDNSTKLTDEQITNLYHDIQEATGWSIRYYGVEGYDRQIFNIFGFLADKSTLLVGAPEDDFTEMFFNGATYYKGSSEVEERYDNEPLRTYLDLPDDVKRRTAVESTPQERKALYYDTMFYKTYIGWANTGEDGSLSEPSWQIPCLNMKHFYAEYISDMSKFQYYDTGKAAVVIAKYYEGALIGGNVTFEGEDIAASVTVQKNLSYTSDYTIPIDHDKDDTDMDGENATGLFNVIAGAGSQLQISRKLGMGSFILTNITFEGENGTAYAPITDDDAMRVEGSNYNRTLNIEIEPASLEGYIYHDEDDDGEYDSSNDTTLYDDITVELREITNFMEDNQIQLAAAVPLELNESGRYNTSGLIPGFYRLTVKQGDFKIYENDLPLYSGKNVENIAEPKPSGIEGVVYYDDDESGEYDSGEEKDNVKVDLVLRDDQEKIVDSVTTDATGKYSFDSIKPGQRNTEYVINNYVIRASYIDPSSTVTTHIAEESATLMENETTTFNVSLQLYPVSIEGFTKQTHDNNIAEGVELTFMPDESVDDNTAEDNTAVSDGTGLFTVELAPGTYNITASKIGASGTIIYEGDTKLIVELRQSEQAINIDDILVDKKSGTVSGTTSHEGTDIANVSIQFTKDVNFENNTAVSTSTQSDESGFYTIELTPGNYSVSVSHDFEENGQNYTYTFVEKLEIESAPSTKTFDIAMKKE